MKTQGFYSKKINAYPIEYDGEDCNTFEHNVIMISSTGDIYNNFAKVRPSLPYQGIARNFQFMELSIVVNPPDPNCIIKRII